jgi:transcription elongation factor GreA
MVGRQVLSCRLCHTAGGATTQGLGVSALSFSLFSDRGQGMIDKPVYLTREGKAKLDEELRRRIEQERPAIADRIKQAKDLGDLSENSEYEAAKNEQAFNEGRIRELNYMLNNAQIIEETNGSKVVRIGSTVIVRDEDGEEDEYTIVGSSEANPANGRISNESPVGRALLGQPSRKKVEVESPNGKYKLTIVKIR